MRKISVFQVDIYSQCGLVVYLAVRSSPLKVNNIYISPRPSTNIQHCCTPGAPTSHLQSKYEVLKSHYVVFTKCTDFLTFLCLDCKVSPMQWLEISSRFLSSCQYCPTSPCARLNVYYIDHKCVLLSLMATY